jgi:hypothetical protein
MRPDEGNHVNESVKVEIPGPIPAPTGPVPIQSWQKANRSTVWLWIGAGVAGTLGVEVIAATVIAVLVLQ